MVGCMPGDPAASDHLVWVPQDLQVMWALPSSCLTSVGCQSSPPPPVTSASSWLHTVTLSFLGHAQSKEPVVRQAKLMIAFFSQVESAAMRLRGAKHPMKGRRRKIGNAREEAARAPLSAAWLWDLSKPSELTKTVVCGFGQLPAQGHASLLLSSLLSRLVTQRETQDLLLSFERLDWDWGLCLWLPSSGLFGLWTFQRTDASGS
mmetsp:Transcript_195/g.375  ORF Transcript_195/g.375 Transcript_195/m.375 type:complete len:205 (+) Transcript_195:50-664(+)